MDTPDSGKAPNEGARPQACEDCDAYRAHIGHEGLVYRFVYNLVDDGKRGYHGHIAICPDSAAADPQLVN